MIGIKKKRKKIYVTFKRVWICLITVFKNDFMFFRIKN